MKENPLWIKVTLLEVVSHSEKIFKLKNQNFAVFLVFLLLTLASFSIFPSSTPSSLFPLMAEEMINQRDRKTER